MSEYCYKESIKELAVEISYMKNIELCIVAVKKLKAIEKFLPFETVDSIRFRVAKSNLLMCKRKTKNTFSIYFPYETREWRYCTQRMNEIEYKTLKNGFCDLFGYIRGDNSIIAAIQCKQALNRSFNGLKLFIEDKHKKLSTLKTRKEFLEFKSSLIDILNFIEPRVDTCYDCQLHKYNRFSKREVCKTCDIQKYHGACYEEDSLFSAVIEEMRNLRKDWKNLYKYYE